MNENNKNIHIASGAFKRKLKQLMKNEKLIKSNKKIDSFFKSDRVEGETTSKPILNDSYDSDNLVQVPSTSALASVEVEESEGGLEVGESVNVPSSDWCVGSQEEETDT